MASVKDFENLLNAVGDGDRKAFHALFDLTAAKLFGLCKAILEDDDWADEVLEQAYIDIWQSAINWQDAGLTPVTWVLTVVREDAIAARRAASAGETPDPVELQSMSPSRSVETSSEGPEPLVRRALNWLPKDRREAFILSYFSGIRYSELAARYRVPYATVRHWQQRSLSRLYNDLCGKTATYDVILAGEYVLDVLPSLEHQDFENRLAKEPDLRALVAGWTEDFVALTDSLPEMSPRSDLLARLDRVLFPEMSMPFYRRFGLVQYFVWASAAAVVAWAAYLYWPGMSLPTWLGSSAVPQQNVAQITAPPDEVFLPDTGPIFARFDPAQNLLRLGGDVSAITAAANPEVYLDFGDNTEWIDLGPWPELPPRNLPVPKELSAIVKGAEVVVLGGQGSDREIVRLPIN